jgi:hypothetical protein
MRSDAWFKPKPVGYGNVPSNWKGWAVTIAFALFVVGIVGLAQADALPHTWVVVIALAVTAIYLPFIRAKTSGEWRWRSRADHE